MRLLELRRTIGTSASRTNLTRICHPRLSGTAEWHARTPAPAPPMRVTEGLDGVYALSAGTASWDA